MSETSKERQSRIDLRYYKLADAQLKWRRRLTILVIMVVGAWVAIAPMVGQGRDATVRLFQHNSLASKGTLARAHGMWDADCAVCHVPFSPVNGSRWSPAFWNRGPQAESKCQTCHAGPAHHASQLPNETPSCAECHRDHRGRDASLLSMEDSVCTTCHQDLPRHRNADAGPMLTPATVTRFAADRGEHPEFTPPTDFNGNGSGRIKFNHALHLAKGMAIEKGGVPLWTFASFKNPADRARYGATGGRDNDPVQLRCDSCHRLDGDDAAVGSSRTAGASPPPRSAGATMLPVSYQRDCRACHRLEYDAKAPEREIRHGLKAAEVVEELQRFYAADVVTHDQALLHTFVPPRAVPGKVDAADVRQAEAVVADKTLAALRRLFGTALMTDSREVSTAPQGRGGCVECHEIKASRPLVDLAAARGAEITPVAVRSLWFESARFNHATHRAIDCTGCHLGVTESRDQTKLLLPGINQCVTCHSPATTQVGASRGGAGTACVECHRYHNGDHAGAGVGSKAWRGKSAMTVEQFSRGGLTSGQ